MEPIDWKKITHFLLIISFWTGLALIPLGMSFFFPVFSPFSVIKTAWLQILGSISVILFLLTTKAWRPSDLLMKNRRRYLLAVAPVWIFFLGWAIISIFSVDPSRSWFGSYERHFGLMNYFWLCIWYSFAVYRFSGLLTGGIGSLLSWQRLVRIGVIIMSAVGAVIGLYAFLQFCGFDFAVWQEAQMYSRAIGTLGQPNFLGSFLLLTLPLAVYLLSLTRSLRRRAAVGLLVACQAAGLVVSGSRSAWLALVVTGALAALVWGWKRFKIKVVIIVPATVIFLVALLYFFMPSRVAGLLDINGGSVGLRQYFYRAGISAIAERPWLGIGLENGGETLVKYYQPDWAVFMKVDGYTDKVHDSIADVIIQTGIIGFLFYAFLYLFFIQQCWQLYRHPQGRTFALAASSALLAYCVSILFGLSDIASVFFFWIIAAMVVSGNLVLAEDRKEVKSWRLNIPTKIKMLARWTVTGLLMAAGVGQIYFSLSVLQADYYFLQLHRYLPTLEYYALDNVYSYLRPSAINPVNRLHYQKMIAGYALTDYERVEDISTKKLLESTVGEIRKALPDRGYENMAAKARLTCFLDKGENVADFDALVAYSPGRPALYRERAVCHQLAGESDEALADYDHALSLLPSFSDTRLNYEHLDYLSFYAHRLESEKGRIFVDKGNIEEAVASYRKAYSKYPDDISLLSLVAAGYEQLGNLRAAEATLKHAFLREPSNYRWPLSLAGLKQRQGDKGAAMSYAQQASALSPFTDIPSPTY